MSRGLTQRDRSIVIAVSGEASDEQLVEEVRALVEQELKRLGRNSAPRVEGYWLIVGKGAAEARSDIQGTLAQWDSLPDDLRERRARQIAQMLAQGAAPVPVAPRPQRLANRPGWLSAVAPVVVVVGTSVALTVAYRMLAPHQGQSAWTRLGNLFHAAPSASAVAAPPADPDRERERLAGSACDRTRARISRGATIGLADAEGWEIELVLLRRGTPSDLTTIPALSSFVQRKPGSNLGTWVWPSARALIAAERFDAQVEVKALPALGKGKLSGLSLVFSGPYAAPYFSEEQRSDYALLADALAEAVSATDGALFAHCAGAPSHYIGSWFLGANPAAAVGSLVYFMSGTTDSPALRSDVFGSGTEPERQNQAFDSIDQAASGLDRGSAATLIGRELGMISGRPGKPNRLAFPFRDANRAARASLDAARALNLAAAR